MTVFGHAVLFNYGFKTQKHCVGEDSSEALPQTKVAVSLRETKAELQQTTAGT